MGQISLLGGECVKQEQILLSGRECDPMFTVRNQNNKFVILQSFFMTICTFLQCFPKNSFAVDIMRSKCLHVIPSNVPTTLMT